jgi:hypothetical protein
MVVAAIAGIGILISALFLKGRRFPERNRLRDVSGMRRPWWFGLAMGVAVISAVVALGLFILRRWGA